MQNVTAHIPAARAIVTHPDPRTPLAVRRTAWEVLKAARGQSCAPATPDQHAPAPAILDDARRARLSSRIAAHCTDHGYDHCGPFSGDAA